MFFFYENLVLQGHLVWKYEEIMKGTQGEYVSPPPYLFSLKNKIRKDIIFYFSKYG